MESGHKAVVTSLLLALSLMTALVLEAGIESGVKYQLAFIFLGIVISGVVVFGTMMSRQWAYPLGIIIFVLSLANLLWLFAVTRSLLGFAFGILVNVIGLILCLLSVEPVYSYDSSPINLETYDLDQYAPKRKRGRPPKQVYSNF